MECEAAVASYLEMLKLELRGEPFKKTEHSKALRVQLVHRSKSSIERKHQNISAILIRAGQLFISGYKPLGNYQALLRDVVLERVASDKALAAMAEADVLRTVRQPARPDFLRCEQPHERKPLEAYGDRSGETAHRRAPGLVNWLERDARNAALGQAGEEFVMAFEQARLLREGSEALARRVKHVSLEDGDGAGFDILSFDSDGRERLIEVKTTSYGLHAPFFVTRTEHEVSLERSEEFQLYRVFEFREQPQLLRIRGSLDENFQLDPTQFRTQVA